MRLCNPPAIPKQALRSIDQDVKATVLEAAEFAKNSPMPDPSELYTDVYIEADA